MKKELSNYRLIVSPHIQTGTGKKGFTALCPTLGVADDGDTIEEALTNVKGAINAYVKSLAEDKEIIPTDNPVKDFITTTQVEISNSLQIA